MARPKANPEQHLKAYQHWRDGLGQTVIHDNLEKEFEKPVSERTIANWITGFKTLSKETVSLDSIFQWHLLDKYGLPWEASPFLLEMCLVSQHIDLHTDGEFEHTYDDGQTASLIHLPIVREVVWWWRIHLAAPELGRDFGTTNNIREIAGEFVVRELLHEILGRPLEMADLEAWLTWKPWLSEDRDAEYRQAINRGIIPPVRTELQERTLLYKEGSPISYVLYPRTAFPPTMYRNLSVGEPVGTDV